MHSILHPLQLLERFLVRSNELLHTIPCCAPWENILEHIEGCVMSRHLLNLADALSDSRLVYEDFSVPEAALCSSSKYRILSLDGAFLDLVRAALFLLQSVHESHWFMCLGQMVEFWAVQNALVINRCILFVSEGLKLHLCVLELELLLRLSLACHLNDLIKT